MRTELAALLLIWLTAPALAGVLDDVQAAGVVRIGTTGDYQPFSYRENGNLKGIDISLGQRLGEHLGVEVEWVATSWPTLMDDLQANRFDVAISGISVTAARAKTAYFSQPYFSTGKTVLTRCTSGARFTTLEAIDQPSVRVIVNPGGTNEKFVRRTLHRAQIILHGDNLTVFRSLAAGEADLMITDGIEAVMVAHDDDALCAPIPTTFFEAVDKAVLLPRDDTWRDHTTRWLLSIDKDGTLKTVIGAEIPDD